MSKAVMALRKNGKELTPYITTAQTDGESQQRFAEDYGRPNGQCVAKNVSEGMSQTEIKDAVRDCAR